MSLFNTLPGAKAPHFNWGAGRPKAKALGYLEALRYLEALGLEAGAVRG